MVRLATAAACALALAACGSEPAPSSSSPPGAELTVTVRPDGPGGPVRERRIECVRLGEGEPVCRGLTAQRLAPVPRTTACTAIYGGPAVGRVTGTLRGEPVDARFSLEDGCQIARWERNRDLLGVPGRGP